LFRSEIFRITEYMNAVGEADNHVPAHVQSELYMLFRRALHRSVRHFLIYRPEFDLTEAIERLTPLLTELQADLPDLLVGAEAEQDEAATSAYREAGVSEGLAAWGAGLLPRVRMLDVIEVAETPHADRREVARLYCRAADMVGVTSLMTTVRALSQADRSDSLARSS